MAQTLKSAFPAFLRARLPVVGVRPRPDERLLLPRLVRSPKLTGAPLPAMPPLQGEKNIFSSKTGFVHVPGSIFSGCKGRQIQGRHTEGIRHEVNRDTWQGRLIAVICAQGDAHYTHAYGTSLLLYRAVVAMPLLKELHGKDMDAGPGGGGGGLPGCLLLGCCAELTELFCESEPYLRTEMSFCFFTLRQN